MKIKNLNFIEKHVEKVIIGVGAAFFVYVLWFYVLSQPYRIKPAGAPKLMAPQEVEAQIGSEASQLKNRIESPALPFDPLKVPEFTEDFQTRARRPFLNDLKRFPVPMGQMGIQEATESGPSMLVRVPPDPPKPTDIRAHYGFYVLGTSDNPGLQRAYVAIIGDQTPRDFRAVTVAAMFDMKKWRERLSDVNTPADRQIPEDWWRNKLLVTNVKLERDEVDPASGKEVSPPVEVPPMPTQDPNYGHPPKRWTPQEAMAAFEDISTNQQRICRPDFVPLAVGSYTAPDSGNNLTDDQKSQVKALDAQIAALRAAERALPPSSPAPPGPGPARPGVGRPGPPGPSSAAALEQQIAVLEAQRLQIINGPDAGAPPAPGGGVNFRPGGAAPPLPPPSLIPVWAHDLTVQPGHTYRYRIVVEVLSPLFQRQDLNRDEAATYANKLSLASVPSDWTIPVAVDPVFRYFFVSSDPNVNAANVEVYKIFNGAWTRQEFQVRPGDEIGKTVKVVLPDQTAMDVDYSVGAMMVDLEKAKSSSEVTGQVTRIIVYDPATQQLSWRTIETDLDKPERVELRHQVDTHRGAAAGSTTDARTYN